MFSHAGKLAAGGVCAVLMFGVGLAPANAGDSKDYTVKVVNNTGNDPQHVFVTLTGGTTNPVLPAGMSFGVAYPLEGATTPWTKNTDGSYTVELDGEWTSGTILYSMGEAGDGFTGYTSQPEVGTNTHPYDFSELTFDTTETFNGDLSAVTQIGIPARLSVLKPDGTIAYRNGSSTSLASEYVGCVATTKAVMDSAAPGWDPDTAGVWRTQPDGSFLQIAGPGSASLYEQYPSFQNYVESLAGETITIRGYFGGGGTSGNPAYYNYSGQVDQDGSLWLTGDLYDNPDGTGNVNYPSPQGIYIPAGELYGHDAATWSGTGYGIYAQNGTYVVDDPANATLSGGVWSGSATVPPEKSGDYVNPGDPAWTAGTPGAYLSVGNDLYGWIYGDLVTSYAMGYFGSDAATGTPIFESNLWNTNPPVNTTTHPAGYTWWTENGLPAYGKAWTTESPYARFNAYQYATQTTGTTYGMSLGDRFAPEGTESPEMGVSNTPDGTNYGTWQIELLANTGCAQLDGISSAAGSYTGGETVTLTGHNLREGVKVYFGDAPAEVVDVSYDYTTTENTVTVVAPKHGNGTVDVKVVNVYGDSAADGTDWCVLPSAYTYSGQPTPTPEPTLPVPPPAPSKKKIAGGITVFSSAPEGAPVTTLRWKKTLAVKPGRAPKVATTADRYVKIAGKTRFSDATTMRVKIVGKKKWVKVPYFTASKKNVSSPVLTFTKKHRFLVKVAGKNGKVAYGKINVR